MKRIFYKNSVTAMIQNPFPLLKKYKPDIVISEGAPSYMTIWVLLFLRSFFKYKLIIWSHGVKFKEMDKPFESISGRMRKYLFNRADSIILYSERRKEIVAEHIIEPKKLFVANNTLDTNTMTQIYKELSDRGKVFVKKELQWSSKYNLIFIGRLLESKRLDVLINVFNEFPPELDVALHIVGDGSQKQAISLMTSNNAKIHIYGAIYDDFITSKYLYASDLMVMPGYIGLSVIHAFAFGCPVITCIGNTHSGPFHSPEIEYLQDGYNGYLLINDPVVIARKIQLILEDEDCLQLLSKNAIETIGEKASLSKMLEGFEQAITYLSISEEK